MEGFVHLKNPDSLSEERGIPTNQRDLFPAGPFLIPRGWLVLQDNKKAAKRTLEIWNTLRESQKIRNVMVCGAFMSKNSTNFGLYLPVIFLVNHTGSCVVCVSGSF